MNRWFEVRGAACFALLCMLACRVPAHAQGAPPLTVLWVNCGGEGERPCYKDEANKGWGLLPANTPSDNWDNGNDHFRCDSGLQIHASDNTTTCTNRNRLTVGESDPALNPPWTTFARRNQYDSIQADQPITFAPIFGSHNAYSNYFDGAKSQLTANHGFSITDQLQYGSRLIRLDPWLFDNTDYQIKLCHSSSFTINTNWIQSIAKFLKIPVPSNITLNAQGFCDIEDPLGNSLSLNRSLVFAVKELAHWLRQHPDEVVVLYLHDRGQGWEDVNSIEGIISTTGTEVRYGSIAPQLYYWVAIQLEMGDLVYKNPYVEGGNWNKNLPPSNFRFPSMRQMRAMGKQVLVLSDYASSLAFQASDGNGLLQIQDSPDLYTQELCTAGSPNSIAATHSPLSFAETGEDRSLSVPFQAKMMDAPRLRTALHCGFNEIGLDFLGTLNQAPDPHLLTEAAAPLLGVLVGATAALQSQNFQCNDFSQGANCSTTDFRREAAIWSWAPGSGAPNQPVQMTTANGDPFSSWMSVAPTESAPYLCATQEAVFGPDGTTYSDASYPDNKQWYITQTTGLWKNGETACQTEKGAGWHFQHPMSAVQQDAAYATLLRTSAGAAWINHLNGPIVALPTQITLVPGGPSQTFVVSGGLGGQLTATADSPNIQVTSVPLYSNPDTGGATINNDSNLFTISLTSQGSALAGGNYVFHVKVHETFTLNAVDPGRQPQTLASGGDTALLVNVKMPAKGVVVQIPSNPFNLPVVADGTSYPTPVDFHWAPASSHKLSFATAALGTGKQVVFQQWSDGIASNPRTIVATKDATYTAEFVVQWQVTTSVTPAGAGQVTGGGWVNDGSKVRFTATANGGYGFAGFSGSIHGANSPETVTVPAPLNVVANFTPAQPQVSVTATVIGDSDPNIVQLSLGLYNSGLGAAAPLFVSATAVVTTGSGSVTPPIVPSSVWVQGGSSASLPLNINWPLTAKRIQLTVTFAANNGAYKGSQVLNLFR
jgi:Divergent InlB B-repeat domain